MIVYENRLPADDSHEIPCLFDIFEKLQNISCLLLKIIGGALWVKIYYSYQLNKACSTVLEQTFLVF